MSLTAAPKKPELLAPAGNLEAGLAALQFGADAVYLGLKRFSARAEADNFDLAELDQLVGYAHGREVKRRVFVALNTLVQQHELGELLGVLGPLADIGPDAIIVQDLGLADILRRSFPELSLHASTQLAAHNLEGVQALARLGFRRVTLARELTLEEIRWIVSEAPCEIETFVHGALCYAYSGTCLFSSHLTGRSGNRGRCAYPCRDEWKIEATDGQPAAVPGQGGYAFSMKDLCLTGLVEELAEAGVASLKIEGRKKSPLYVAAAVRAYRRLLDGEVSVEDQKGLEEDIQAVFSRPSTTLYLRSRRNREVIEPAVVGHQGIPIGQVEQIVRKDDAVFIRFRSSRALGLHDGLQIELLYLGKMFGFGVEELWVNAGQEGIRARSVSQAEEGARVEVRLPEGYPTIPRNARVFCSSSQEVKARYRLVRPGAKDCRNPRPLDIALAVDEHGLRLRARLEGGPLGEAVTAELALEGPLDPAKNQDQLAPAARSSLEKLGDTRFDLRGFTYVNPQGLFVRLSALNHARRLLIERLEETLSVQQRAREERLCGLWLGEPERVGLPASPAAVLRWGIKLDRIATLLDLLAEGDPGVEEITLDIGLDPLDALREGLARAGGLFPRARLRLALPIITRLHEQGPLQDKIEALRQAGYTAWEGANISALSRLGREDAFADWPLYALNRPAIRALLADGFRGVTLSPEDDGENLGALLGSHGAELTLIVYQDTPLFVSESCPLSALTRQCPGPERCAVERLSMRSFHGNRVEVSLHDCRAVVVNVEPFSLAHRIPELLPRGLCRVRADFMVRPYQPAEIRAVLQRLRAFERLGHEGNYARGLQ